MRVDCHCKRFFQGGGESWGCCPEQPVVAEGWCRAADSCSAHLWFLDNTASETILSCVSCVCVVCECVCVPTISLAQQSHPCPAVWSWGLLAKTEGLLGPATVWIFHSLASANSRPSFSPFISVSLGCSLSHWQVLSLAQSPIAHLVPAQAERVNTKATPTLPPQPWWNTPSNAPCSLQME